VLDSASATGVSLAGFSRGGISEKKKKKIEKKEGEKIIGLSKER